MEREAKRLLLCVPCETTVARKEICHAQARSIKNRKNWLARAKICSLGLDPSIWCHGLNPLPLLPIDGVSRDPETLVISLIVSNIYRKQATSFNACATVFSPAPGLDGVTLQRARSTCRLQVFVRTRGQESA